MQQAGDYTSQYYSQQYQSNPNPNPIEFPANPTPAPAFASTPPYQPYPSYPHNSDPSPYAPPPPQPLSSAADPYSHLNQQQQQQQQTVPYPSYDNQKPAISSYAPPTVSTNPAPNPYPPYEIPYGSGGGYFDENYENLSRYGSNTAVPYGRSSGSGYERDDVYGEGVYAYDGGSSEPYGARGTVPARSNSSSWTGFDEYGRATGYSSSQNEQGGSLGKIVKAVPKVEVQQDVRNGVQKFRMRLLPEGGGQSTMDVLCQIGLDGIRMLDPSNNRTLRIYPLETVTRWEVMGSSIFAFWAKSSVDFEPRRIRLESNSYTTNTILDTVTAATVQLKEMGGKDGIDRSKAVSESARQSEPPSEKKKGIIDWVNLIKPLNEEKDHWVPDEAVSKCTSCRTDFGAFVRKHHCRNCGDIFCDKCTSGRIALTADENAQPVRVCDGCMAEVTRRLSHVKESISKPAGIQSHEDLARKLQEEMEKNRKASTGLKPSDGSGKRMREVACPICTVHLQVQVPSSGSETIECGVCQHPFLVSAH